MNIHRGSDFNDFIIEENLMTPTPRTDEFARAECCDLEHALDFARQMERELATIAPPSPAMNSITTPRIDALMPTQGRKRTTGEYILEIEEHARRLERELADALEQVAILRSDEKRLAEFAKTYRLRAEEAEDKLAAWKEARP